MFCPKCSQEQISIETRFCSRCGFQMNVVKELLTEDGLPSSVGIQKTHHSFSKRDMTLGALLMFVFALFVAFITIDVPPGMGARILFLIIAWFALTLLINAKPIIEYLLRGDSNAPVNEPSLSSKIMSKLNLPAESSNPILPAAQSIPADFVMRSINTGEIVQPLSVTEETTNLLNKK